MNPTEISRQRKANAEKLSPLCKKDREAIVLGPADDAEDERLTALIWERARKIREAREDE